MMASCEPSLSPARERAPGVFVRLDLFGYLVDVAWVEGLQKRAELQGLWSWERMTIELDIDLSATEAQEILIHECAHAASDIAGLDMTEHQIRVLALCLQQMLGPYLTEIK